jgi:hypothetical protein
MGARKMVGLMNAYNLLLQVEEQEWADTIFPAPK